MAHDRAANDGVRAVQGNLDVGDVHHGDAVRAGSDVAEVAGVALLVGRGAVLLASGVEVGTGAHAAVGGVAQLVNVEAVLARREAGDLTSHLGAAALRGEGDGASDTGSSNENANLCTQTSSRVNLSPTPSRGTRTTHPRELPEASEWDWLQLAKLLPKQE